MIPWKKMPAINRHLLCGGRWYSYSDELFMRSKPSEPKICAATAAVTPSPTMYGGWSARTSFGAAPGSAGAAAAMPKGKVEPDRPGRRPPRPSGGLGGCHDELKSTSLL